MEIFPNSGSFSAAMAQKDQSSQEPLESQEDLPLTHQERCQNSQHHGIRRSRGATRICSGVEMLWEPASRAAVFSYNSTVTKQVGFEPNCRALSPKYLFYGGF